ncbi:MAG: CTP synthase [Chlamydiia bacterium]|nr:CTP synthase [Chlamydiia bacterium]
MSVKYIFITGGVCSSLGKGLTAAVIGLLLEKKGLKVSMLKLDPYLNVDPGTMSPYQHGEVYVTDDGAETDLDLGHYHRFTDSPLTRISSTTSGQLYHEVIKRERRGDYLGNTVQVIPHITDEVKARIVACGKQDPHTNVVIAEVGGTVGDIESYPFLEAIRQFRYEHDNDCVNIHLTYVPYLKAAGEVKTKPTQQSVQLLRGIGITPDLIICRSEEHLDEDVKQKISLFCNVSKDGVIEATDVDYIYEMPLKLHEQGLDHKICEILGLKEQKVDLSDWQKIVDTLRKPKGTVTIGIVGKYVQHQDAYKSVYESLRHAAIANGYDLEVKYFEADKLLDHGTIEENISGCDGYLVPGGFGERGWLGKIMTAKHCREKQIPYFGICLGMQVLATEFARHVCGMDGANTTEIDPYTKYPIISLLSEQKDVQDVGGTMRLGAFPCRLKKGSKAHQAYGQDVISERHRHRYEFNNEFLPLLEEKGFEVTGRLDGGNLCEIAEVKGHPWMLGAQFHPEFLSKPTDPHPLFCSFVKAAIQHKEGK